MKKIIINNCKLLLGFALILVAGNTFSQQKLNVNSYNSDNSKQPRPCGSYTIDAAALSQALSFESANTFFAPTHAVRVYFHICRNTNGSNPAATEAQVKSEFNDLVGDNSANNICFINMGLDYLDNTTVNTDPNSSLLSSYLVPGCLNIFYHADMIGCGCGGSAYSIPNTFCSIHKNNIGIGHTISHEVGHCLGLYHTFETAFGTEKINGSNASSAGDKITDTPADPFSHSGNTCFTTSGCLYTGNCTDPNGATNFTPPYSNIMTYWPVAKYPCYLNILFTQGQFTRTNSFLSTNAGLTACEAPNTYTLNASNYSSGLHLHAAKNTLTTNGSINITGPAEVTLGGGLLLVEPGFHATPASGGLILIRPSSCTAVAPKFSDEISYDNESKNFSTMKCYPNPFSDNLTIVLNLTRDDSPEISIYDLIGKKMKSASKSFLAEGRHEIKVDLSQLNAGAYFIIVQSDNFRQQQKIIKSAGPSFIRN